MGSESLRHPSCALTLLLSTAAGHAPDQSTRMGASILALGGATNPEDQRLHTGTIVNFANDFATRAARKRCLVVSSRPQLNMVCDYVGEQRFERPSRCFRSDGSSFQPVTQRLAMIRITHRGE